MGKKCTEIIYECIQKNKNKATISFSDTKDSAIKGAIVNISTNNLLQTSASIDNIESNGYVKLTINANEGIILKSKESTILEIWNSIVHELGHGNIYWKRYKNNQNINDTPDEYEKWNTVIKNNNMNPNDIAYLFCYALYSTYYHEIQAFISQTYSGVIVNLNKLYGTTKNITKEQFINALVETNTYQTYKSNLYISEKLLNSKGLRTILIKKLIEHGLSYTDKQVVNKSKEIIEKSNDALKASYNNAYQWFYNSFEK